MTYTRKEPRVPKNVTFNVSWIAEEITVVSATEIPFLALSRSIMGDYSGVLELLPNDLLDVLETSSGEEFQEFMNSWIDASKKDVDSEKEVDQMFTDIMGREDFNFGGK